MGRLVARKVSDLVATALTDTRVVLINGARQVGKSTLVAGICRDQAGEWRNLDRPLEGFVAMELSRRLEWSITRAELFHHRTRDGVEVDLVLERRSGDVIAIDVKASSTVRAEDVSGIRHLRERLGRLRRRLRLLHRSGDPLLRGSPPRHTHQRYLGGCRPLTDRAHPETRARWGGAERHTDPSCGCSSRWCHRPR